MRVTVRTLVTLSFALSFLVSFSFAQAPPQLTPFSADMSYSSIAKGSRPAHDMDGKMYIGHDHMRMEMAAGPRSQSVILTNIKTQVTDILMPEQQMYMEHKAGEMAGRRQGMMSSVKPFRDPSNPCADEQGMTCKNMGVEQVNGRTCDHWQITDKNGKVTNTWVDQTLHFPIKSVSDEGTWELTNIKEGEPAASLFEIPAGYRKMDMGNMMRGMGGMQGAPQQQ